jgi:dephospho-CoA kinase
MFPNTTLPLIGLTGLSGAGKTTAADLFREMGCYVLDGDMLAREVTRTGSPENAALAAYFGADILTQNGQLKRAVLAERAFQTEAGRQKLNAITHPAISKLAWTIAAALPKGYEAIVLDAAALPESDLLQFCDVCLLMTAPEEERLRRLLLRDALPEKALKERLAAQHKIDYSCCTHTYENNAEKSLETMQSYLKGVLRDGKEKAKLLG